jgi:hypothetical protein
MTYEQAWQALLEDLEERDRWAQHIRTHMGREFSEPAGQGQWDAIRWMRRRMAVYERWFIAGADDPPEPSEFPSVCSVTGMPLFRVARHPSLGWVPLYGHRWFCFAAPRALPGGDEYETDFFAYYDGVWEPMGVRFRKGEGIRYAFDRYTWLKRLARFTEEGPGETM